MQQRPGDPDWWRGAVIYQIYPRSFMDSNGDGIGDLAGITARLDYVAALGVDAIWISPFFTSPMRDFGYDISDYRQVDPIFGTLDDFDRLLARAHALGLRVLIDQVLSHTSDQHAWFTQSRASRHNEKADWYVWSDPLPDGTPPNNWLSIFGGSAWQWDSRRKQYYLHNFLGSQPDLNLHSPAVQAQLLDEVRFWLERGVDGFRFDVVNFYFHDQQLRDNPAWGTQRPRRDFSTPLSNPYSYQQHLFDKTQPENIAFLQRLRGLMNQYGATTSVGEIGDDDALAVMARYTSGGDKLHMAYTFNLLGDALSGRHIRSVVETVEEGIADGWPCWSIGNHDTPRVVSRMGGPAAAPELGNVLLALMLSLRGSACIYQGEELGLSEAEIAFERLQDPYGIAFWPDFKGRDGCRTPMPWESQSDYAGFSRTEPWLPMCPQHTPRAADVQQLQGDSVLNRSRQFLEWRKAQPVLRKGAIRLHDAPDSCVLLSRSDGDHILLGAFNLSAATVELARPFAAVSLEGHGMAGTLVGEMIVLPPYEAWFGAST
ncbi:MAG: alpha-amylase family glycosyl hydrolase [Pseudomonadota bacterium]